MLWRENVLFLHSLVREGLTGKMTFEQRDIYLRDKCIRYQGNSLLTKKVRTGK